jgi:hypothetical protein
MGPKSGLRFRDICDARDLRVGIILPYESIRSKMLMSASASSGPCGRRIATLFRVRCGGSKITPHSRGAASMLRLIYSWY